MCLTENECVFVLCIWVHGHQLSKTPEVCRHQRERACASTWYSCQADHWLLCGSESTHVSLVKVWGDYNIGADVEVAHPMR